MADPRSRRQGSLSPHPHKPTLPFQIREEAGRRIRAGRFPFSAPPLLTSCQAKKLLCQQVIRTPCSVICTYARKKESNNDNNSPPLPELWPCQPPASVSTHHPVLPRPASCARLPSYLRPTPAMRHTTHVSKHTSVATLCLVATV